MAVQVTSELFSSYGENNSHIDLFVMNLIDEIFASEESDLEETDGGESESEGEESETEGGESEGGEDSEYEGGEESDDEDEEEGDIDEEGESDDDLFEESIHKPATGLKRKRIPISRYASLKWRRGSGPGGDHYDREYDREYDGGVF